MSVSSFSKGAIAAVPHQLARFIVAGALGTTAHYVLLIGLVEMLHWRPVIASSAGMLIGASINYVLNRNFVFRSQASHYRGLPRFLTVAASAFGLNALVMAVAAESTALPYLAAQVLSTGIVTMMTFAAHRAWTFDEQRG
jgi:putative flippase GtrA